MEVYKKFGEARANSLGVAGVLAPDAFGLGWARATLGSGCGSGRSRSDLGDKR